MEYTIGLITPNQGEVTPKSISKLIKLEKVKSKEMMELIVKVIGLDHNMMGATSTIYENEKIVYQICYLDQNRTQKCGLCGP